MNARFTQFGETTQPWCPVLALAIGMAGILWMPLSAQGGALLSDGFEGYDIGYSFVAPTNGWAASSSVVVVETNTVVTGLKAVVLPAGGVALSNTVSGAGTYSRLWTDQQVYPALGAAPDSVGSDHTSLTLYFNANGYVTLWNNGWVVCDTNDAGQAVAPVSNSWARVSVYEDFSGHTAAVFLNGHLLRQNVAFSGNNANSYGNVEYENSHTTDNSLLDDVLVSTNVPAGMTADDDNDGMADALEMQLYGNSTTFRRLTLTAVATNLSGPGSGGTIVPPACTVRPGDATNFVLTATNGCYVADAVTNGASVGSLLSGKYTASASFNYSNIMVDTVVTAQFRRLPQVTITVTNLSDAGTAGSISTGTNFVMYPLASTNIDLTASSGYYLANILTNGVSATGLLTGQYTAAGRLDYTSGVNDVAMTVQFSRKFQISVVTNTVGGPGGAGGAIIAGSTDVFPGGNVSFTLTANPAYAVTDVKTNGVSGAYLSSDPRHVSYVWSNIWADATLTARFTYHGNRYVPADYAAIEDAVAAAAANEHIYVSNGTYNLAHPAVILAPLTITGDTNTPGNVVLSAPGSGDDRDIFQVRAHNVSIQGFRMMGALNGTPGNSNGWINAAIMVGNDSSRSLMATNVLYEGITNGIFSANEFTNCSFGAYLHLATNCAALNVSCFGNGTGVWADAATDWRSNWWGAASGPSGSGPGSGDPVNAPVLYSPWKTDSAGQHWGYYVGATDSVQSLFNRVGNGDLLVFAGGSHTEDVALASSVTVTGAPVVINGVLSLTASQTLTLGTGVILSNISVSAGAAVTVVNSAIVVTNLSIGPGGTLTLSNGTLTLGGMVLSGPLVLTDSWGMPAALPYTETFERYNTNMPLSAAAGFGWSATPSVVVQANQASEGSKSVLFSTGDSASNSITTAATHIWTDCWLLPQLGVLPDLAPDPKTSVQVSFTTNGYAAVMLANGLWEICSTDANGHAVVPVSNAWVRVTILEDFVQAQAAVLLNGVVLRQCLSFPGTGISGYNHLSFIDLSSDLVTTSYVDNISIGTTLPPNLTGDGDHDGVPDAVELDRYGSLNSRAGAVYTIR